MYYEDYQENKDYWAVINIDYKFQAHNQEEIKRKIEKIESYIKEYDKGVSIDDVTIEEN